MNKIFRVTFTGGIVGMFSKKEQQLNDACEKLNGCGYKVIQILEDRSSNLVVYAIRLFLFVVTCGLFTTENGYILLLERVEK